MTEDLEWNNGLLATLYNLIFIFLADIFFLHFLADLDDG